MKQVFTLLFLVVSVVVTGCAVTPAQEMASSGVEPVRPAYLIISVNEIHPDKMGPYKKAVRPVVLEKAGGAELLGVSQQKDIQLLEGEWDFPGILLIERFESMEALKRYWYSQEHQEVKKLRDGFAEANFFIAIEGQPL